MAVEDLLKTLRETRLTARQPKFIPPSSKSNLNFMEDFANRRAQSPQFEQIHRNKNTTELAADIAEKSAGQIQTNEWGIPTKSPVDITSIFNRQAQTITYRGELAAQAAEAKQDWKAAKQLQDLNNTFYTTGGYDPNDIPAGASSNSKGAQAVALAMKAYKNGTPYRWGGNSLTNGIDCSGLVQQVYKKLGINLPRTTYTQAKAGRAVPISKLQPGDLVFYNTGSADPNGIGKYGHVAMYIGNGKVVEAYNTRVGMRVAGISQSYRPALGVRPW